MQDIEDVNKIDLNEIFGEEKVSKWKETYPIFENEDILNWVKDKLESFTDEGKKANKFSLTSYLKPMQVYSDYYKCTNPSDFLTEKIDARNKRVKTFLQYLQNDATEEECIKLNLRKKPTNSTIRNQLQSRIKSFYANRGLNVSFGMKAVKSGANKNELVLDKAMIRLIKNKLNSANYRIIVKFQTQLGFRISDVLEQLIKQKTDKTPEYTIEKFKDHYFIREFECQKEMTTIPYVFFTKELTETLISITGITDLTKLDLTTLMHSRSKFKKDENKEHIKDKNGNHIKINKNKKIDRITYLKRLKAIVEDLGITGNMKTHAFRKFFISQVDKCKALDEKFKLILSGHEMGFRDQAYIKNYSNIEWFYDNWKMIEEVVCIDCIVYDRTSEITKNLQDKYDALIESDNQKDKIINTLSSRLNRIEEMLEDHGLIKVEVDPETYEKYKIIAKAQGISISEVIKNLTDKNLEKL